jgi:hypothetical protein
VCSLENPLGKQIEVLAPLHAVVAVRVDVPDVRDLVLLEVRMHVLADADEAVLVAAA